MYLSDEATQRLLDQMENALVYDEHFQSCIERVCSVLDGLGLRYHFTGGLAASFYGEPRFTQDVDMVIQLSADSPETEALLERLSLGYYINRQSSWMPFVKNACSRLGSRDSHKN